MSGAKLRLVEVDDQAQDLDADTVQDITDQMMRDWGNKALSAAFDIVKHGVDGRPELAHLDANPLGRALTAVPDAMLSALVRGDDKAHKAAASLINLWKDVVHYEGQAMVAKAEGRFDEKSVEAANMLRQRAQMDAQAFRPKKAPNKIGQ